MTPLNKDLRLDKGRVVRLFLKNQSMIRAYICAIVRDLSLVDDLVQEVAVVVVERAETSTDAERFAAWVRGIARRVALSYGRKHRRVRCLDAETLDFVDSRWDDYLQDMVLEERKIALDDCVGKLQPGSRRLLKLRYEDGMRGKDIAVALERSLHGVHVALSKIHRALSDCVNQWFVSRETS